MTDRNKFEEMLERLVNEDKEGAEALFHEIVVEKSRDIYEGLLEDEEVEETTDEEVDEAADEEVDESDEDLDEATDEEVDESDEDLDEATDEVEEGMFDEGGDPADELGMDIEMPGADDGEMDMDMDMGGDEAGDDMGMGDEGGDVEDRIEDLEDELEALKAEFADMMGDEAGDDEDDMDMGGDDAMAIDMDTDDAEEDPAEAMAFEADEEVEEATDEEVEESKLPKSNSELMREYADKVAPAKMGDNGANAKSPTAKPNNMGGTSANIVGGGEADTKGTTGGLSAPSAKDMNTKNVNVPGAKGATKMSNQPGHGAEKKGAAPNQDAGAKSPLNGAPKRAK